MLLFQLSFHCFIINVSINVIILYYNGLTQGFVCAATKLTYMLRI